MAEPVLRRKQLEELARSQPAALVKLVLQQSEMLAQQKRAIAALEERVRQLEEALRERGGGGGAAPFRIEPHKRKAQPKAAGRKPGHRGEFRAVPGRVDQTIEVPLEQCPGCGGALGKTTPLVQTIIELPEVRPVAVRLITHRARCPHCARVVQSTHPLQMSGTGRGVASTQLGPRAVASAALLRHGVGLTLSSCGAVLEKLFALPVSRGGLSQALDRLAGRMSGQYEELARQLRRAAVVHTDETSWWLNNERSTLWVFATPEQTLYRVVERRDRATLHETIAPDYAGVLVSDCLSIYDEATARQHKCYAHHLKAIRAAQAARASPSGWLEQVEALLKSAIGLSKQRLQLDLAQWQRQRRALDLAVHAVLEERVRACPMEEAVRARLWKQRDHLFVFLDAPGVDATNNLAERQLRPAVIRRKLSCGNKTRRGARTFEVLASLAATCRQRGQDFLHLAASSARFQPA
jgi:transposase